MYLKSIEIQGFKSFANRTLLEFHNGITGIVGPNGSGKSNVADAVRWVLGEQRAKQLRGASMQDVIFSGTELRRALSYASVAITLDNSDHKLAVDFDEVTVTMFLTGPQVTTLPVQIYAFIQENASPVLAAISTATVVVTLLVVMLLGFTAVQHAFSEGQVSVGTMSEVERRALALTGSGDFVFD